MPRSALEGRPSSGQDCGCGWCVLPCVARRRDPKGETKPTVPPQFAMAAKMCCDARKRARTVMHCPTLLQRTGPAGRPPPLAPSLAATSVRIAHAHSYRATTKTRFRCSCLGKEAPSSPNDTKIKPGCDGALPLGARTERFFPLQVQTGMCARGKRHPPTP